MNLLSLLGVALALFAILGGNYLEGGHIGALLNGPAALIVLGGTLGAALVQTPFQVVRRALGMALWLFVPPRIDLEQGISKVVEWSQTARSLGLLGLETLAENEEDDYACKGLQLLADGCLGEKIRSTLELDLIVQENRDLQAARLFESMGGYSPTIGIIGAVLGLIHVMSNLENANSLGQGIAVAFVATIYGVAFANLLLLPLAGRLKAVIHQQAQYRQMLLEGLLSVAEGENPRSIELKLQAFMH